MKAGHTAGPWHIEENFMAGGISHLAIVASDGVTMPCSVSPMKLRRSEDDANARLIAACPDMFNALHSAANMLEYIPANTDITTGLDASIRDTLLTVNAALARAKEGKE